jgi:hypothetical protein
VTAAGGPLITAPSIVSVTFPGDPLAAQLTSFGSNVASTTYWDAVRAGYCIGTSCVGDGPAGTAVALTAAPAASYTDSTQGGASTLQTWLAGLITANTLPAPTANTIYALYFPATVSVTLDGAASCTDFFGYHNQMTMGTQTVVYSVINECAPPQGSLPSTLLGETTDTASHEFMESATDGITTGNMGGFYLDTTKASTWAWNDILGGEVADLCVDEFGLGLDIVTENGFTVQRIWSLSQAAAGKNPCVPIPSGEVYFNAFPEQVDVIENVGDSMTITVDALSDAAMGAWTVSAQDWSGGTSPYLSFTIQGGTTNDAGTPSIQVQSGDRIQVTVKLLADPSTAPNQEADGAIVSVNSGQTAAHFWPFFSLTPAEATGAGLSRVPRHHVPIHHPVLHHF